MSKLITLTIDGKTVQVPSGTLIVNAAKQVGIDIPVFCYHPKMEPVGMCRMCLVDVGRPVIDRSTSEVVKNPDGSPKIQFGPKLETACTTPVSEGMVVVGLSDKVQAARKEIIEFILTSHPLDCPVCDKGGECPLQDQTMAYGSGLSRFLYDEKLHLAKHIPLGDLIFLDRERCIQCARCFRFQDEVVGEPVIGFYNRGRAWEIITSSEPGFDSYFSGNTTDICPVGALTTADFRFGARLWELRATASLCAQCPVGCNIVYNVRREARSDGQVVIKRVMPRQNEAVNEIWICDKGRFAYHYTESSERITQPLVRKNGELVPATWDEALDLAAAKLNAGAGSLQTSGLLTLASGRLSNEDLFNLHALTTSVGGKTALYTHMAGGDLVGQVGLGKGTNFADMGPGTAILVVASDLQEEAPIWWLRVKQAARRGATLIVANPRFTRTDRYAHHVLRYTYGQEASTVLTMVNALSAKRPEIPGKVTLSAELKAAAEAFAQAENAVVIYGSEGLGLEGSQALAQACANLLITTNHTGRPNNGLLAVWPRANDQGAWDLGFQPTPDLSAAFADAKVIYLAACDPANDEPALADSLYQALQAGAFLVVQDLFLTASARLADVVLPAQAYTEREGTFTSGERRVQRYYPAVLPRPQSKPDFEITALLGKRLGLDLEADFPARVMLRLAAKIPAYAELGANPYRKLAEVTEQWPVVGNGDVYYGGTTYENTQGLGVQLASAVERGEVVSLAWPEPPAAINSSQIVQALASNDVSTVNNDVPIVNLVAVPITILYDRGQTVLPSTLLSQRIPKPYVVVNPQDAEKLELTGSSRAKIVRRDFEQRRSASQVVEVRQDESLPQGFVLIPRSLGIPITRPQIVEISKDVLVVTM
jgi:NADH-quinone oxidoreductase subunit G